MHFLIKNLLVRYRENFETFDLCGADHRSLSEFKEKFGQKLVVRFALEKYRDPFSEVLLKGFAWMRGKVG